MQTIVEPVAMVFAHPGHELAASGLIQRYRPHVLYLTAADSSGETERSQHARAVLERLGIGDRATYLDLSERTSYGHLLAGEHAPYLQLRDRMREWHERVQPASVLGDAWELYNFHHDLCRAMLDSAVRQLANPPRNFELPLICYPAGGEELRYQHFPTGAYEQIDLTDAELEGKRRAVAYAAERMPEIPHLQKHYPLTPECYRPVPAHRRYSLPPAEYENYYERQGAEQVARGKYRSVLTFAQHFAPLARALGVG